MDQLLSHATADGAGAVLLSSGAVVTVHAFGAFDGATVSVVVSSTDDMADGVVDDGLSFTSAGVRTLIVPGGMRIWANVSNAGGSTDVSCNLVGQRSF